MTDMIIEARNLVKTYDSKRVVDGINLQVKKGECFGVLGPNGAGKTSAMRMMYCSSPVSAGALFVLGHNVKEESRRIKSRIGVVPQDNGLDPDFTVIDNLLIYARYHGIRGYRAKSRARELLHFVQLDEYAGYRAEQLSGGMQRRLTIARALINEPELIFLDEPTTGLDPQARLWIWNLLDSLKAKNVTLVLTTHYMEEAEQLCDRIAIIEKGKILSEGRPQDLIHKMIGREVVEAKVNPGEAEYYIKKLSGQFAYQIINNKIRVFVRSGQSSKEAMDLLSAENLMIRRASLDDVFLQVAGYELGDVRGVI